MRDYTLNGWCKWFTFHALFCIIILSTLMFFKFVIVPWAYLAGYWVSCIVIRLMGLGRRNG